MKNEEMFNKNINIAYRIASKYLINYKEEYEDIKQVALMGLWKAVQTFKATHAFSTYAYRVIENEINYYLRKIKKHKNNISINTEIQENITIADTIEDKENWIEKIHNREEIEKIKKVLNSRLLKPREQSAYLLMLQGKKQKEIAKKLECSQA